MATNILQGTRFKDQGTRTELEDIAQQGNVSLTPGSGNSPAGPIVAPARSAPAGIPSPVDALKQLPTDAAPITSGLTVGPGNTPPLPGDAQSAAVLSHAQKLVAVATMAKSPHLRAQATLALRMLVANMKHNVETPEVS